MTERMSEAKEREKKGRDGAFVWRPEGTWGIGEQADEPEVILVDADPGRDGSVGRHARTRQTAQGRGRPPKPRIGRDSFDLFTLNLSASLVKAKQKCEDEGRRFEGTLLVEVRGGRHPLRKP